MKKSAFWMFAMFAAAAVCHAIDPSPRTNALLRPLAKVKDRIVYESFRPETASWDLMIMNADGTDQKNLTNTPGVQELYPQCSPDGKWIAFESCESTTSGLRRIEIIKPDGSGRRTIIESGKQMTWSPDGRQLAFVVPDPDAQKRTGNLSFHDMETGKISRWADGKPTLTQIELDGRAHEIPAEDLFGIANLTWAKNGKWIAAGIGDALGYTQSMVAIEVGGNRVVDFMHQARETTGSILGCRPNFSNDGNMLAWTVCDVSKLFWVDSAPVDYSGPYPKVGEHTHWIRCEVPEEFYHADFSPDGRFIAFSHGVRGNRMKTALYVIGQKAPGWQICVLDTENPNMYTQLTTDGYSNKEPDWLKTNDE